MDEVKWKEAGAKLKECRKSTKLSIFKAAKKIHISGNYLSRLERGINAPSDTVIFNLAEFYKIEPAELFALYNRTPSPNSEKFNSIPSLRKILTEISLDSRLTSEEKEEFANTVYQLTLNLKNKEKK